MTTASRTEQTRRAIDSLTGHAVESLTEQGIEASPEEHQRFIATQAELLEKQQPDRPERKRRPSFDVFTLGGDSLPDPEPGSPVMDSAGLVIETRLHTPIQVALMRRLDTMLADPYYGTLLSNVNWRWILGLDGEEKRQRVFVAIRKLVDESVAKYGPWYPVNISTVNL